LLGGQNAFFFKAQPFGVSKAPDLHIIDLNAAPGQLSFKTAKGEVTSHAILAPVTVSASKNRNLVPTHFACSSIPGCAIAL
jgi:hypothetical protein